MCRRRVRLLKDLKSMQQMMLWCGRRRLLRKDGLRGVRHMMYAIERSFVG